VEPVGAVVVSEPEREDLGGTATRFRFPIRVGRQDRSVRIDVPEPGVAVPPSALVPSALLVAMRERLPLVVEATVSAQLAANLTRAQAILHSWDPTFSVVPVELAGTTDEGPRGEATASFFTAGVDSFFSAITHGQTLDRLVYVRGLEEFPDQEAEARALDDIERSAAALGIPLAVLDTDLRRLTDPSLAWFWAHGASLACVAIALGHGRVLVPSTTSYANLRPNGSHPLLDPLWSTERVSVVHDGAELTRGEKVQRIGAHPAVLDGLRTCYELRTAELNCQRCGKCLHTMVSLEIAGALAGSRTFTRPLTFWSVALMESSDNPIRADYLNEYLDQARRAGSPLRLQVAIRIASLRLHAALPLRAWIDRHRGLRRWLGRVVHGAGRLLPR
jgi:hypothetical protein